MEKYAASAAEQTPDDCRNRVPDSRRISVPCETCAARLMRARIGMPKSPDLRIRSFDFAVAIVRLCRSELTDDPIARRLAFQLVSAAGSVGANLEESRGGQTKPDFIAKQFIALKEARESRFWLKIIATSYPRTAEKLRPLIEESNELVAMLTASIKTAKSNPLRGVAVAGIEPRKWEAPDR